MPLPDLNTSAPFRFFAVLVLAVALTVPIALVWIVVELRSDYEQEASDNISQGWGPRQVIVGPFLHFKVRITNTKNSKNQTSGYRIENYFVTPKTLTVESSSATEVRQRGIFEKPVFLSTTAMKGNFADNLKKLAAQRDVAPSDIESCSLLLGVSFSQSIRSLSGQFKARALEFEPSSQPFGWSGEGVHAVLHKNKNECMDGAFDIQLIARGSNRQLVALVGDESTATVRATWPHPAFEGRQLPDSHDIQPSGFNAKWTSNALARGFASLLDETQWLAVSESDTVGFAYHEPITLYRMVTRAVKYGFFVVGLTLLSIFCLEMLTNVKIHPIQYVIVGGGLALFYLLLLSFSEHIGFVASYVLASTVLASLIAGYAWLSTQQLKFSGSIAGLLAVIYAALYVCLSSTDYALLIGSILLVALFIGLMYATRNMTQAIAEATASTNPDSQ